MDANFAAIRDGLQWLGKSVNPPLSEDEVRRFETEHRIRLPEEYRGFLLHVGNGGAGPGYGLFPLGMEDRGVERVPWVEGDWLVGILSEPFPHTEAWNDLGGLPEPDEELEFDPEWEAGYQERRRVWEVTYLRTENVNGAIPICHLGCGIQQWLVVTGPERGQVWTDRRIDYRGLEPTGLGFLQWYRMWLDDAIRQFRRTCFGPGASGCFAPSAHPEKPPMSDPDWLTDEVFVVADFLTPDECSRYIEMSEDYGFEDALVTSPTGQVLRSDIRNNERVIFDTPDLAEELWERAADLVPLYLDDYRAVGVNERFRFYRYDPGQQFDWHQDAPFERDNGERSFWTFMIYLNDGFEGGETSFDDSCSPEPFDDFQVTPEAGMALFFLHEVHHKGEPVIAGRKYVLRTDVMYAPKGQKVKRRRGRQPPSPSRRP